MSRKKKGSVSRRQRKGIGISFLEHLLPLTCSRFPGFLGEEVQT